MQRPVRRALWVSEEEVGTEHVALWQGSDGPRVEGDFAGLVGGGPARGWYRLALTADWRVRELEAVWSAEGGEQRLRLVHDGAGRWEGPDGERSDLSGAMDVDIAWTPFTNTLPIRRLGLKAGESREIPAVYIAPPSLAVRPVRQRYTCLGGGRWRYESLESGYTAVLTVDEEGLVRQYPGAYRLAGLWVAQGT